MAVDRRRVVGAGLALGVMAAGPAKAADGPFQHGVASGEPGPASLLLWTRLTGASTPAGRWRIATDPAMRRPVAEGAFVTGPERDFTVKVEAQGLRPGTDYWYQFEHGGRLSPIGQSRTLPTGALDRLDLVLACCAMFNMGFFHAYRAIAQRQHLDAVLFVGDYIYEYGGSNYPGLPPIRPADPPHDTITLEDYRRRFAQARRDPDLQAAHARAPWICVWDDHEIANDDWMEGAGQHDPARHGPWSDRKAAAVRAYLEWMPVRDPPADRPYDVQRVFAFGDLATLIVPETRLKARQAQLSLPRDLEMLPGEPPRPDVEGFRRKIADLGRRLLGDEQLAWMEREMTSSVAARRRWVVLGSAVTMADYVYPDVSAFAPADGRLKGFFEMTRLGLPLLNLDAWSGYAAERQRVYDLIRRSGARTLVLSGDSHMSFLNELHDDEGRLALELGATTLTGPSLGKVLALEAAPFGQLLADRNRDVQWCDHLAIGFVAATLTPAEVRAEFLEVADPRGVDPTVRVAKRVQADASASGLSGWRDL